MPATLAANQRSWYDGLVLNKVVIVPEIVSLTIAGDLTLNTQSSLLLDIYSADNFDQLQVEGKLEAAGTLIVTLHPEAPPPRAGDSFAIIQSEWIKGEFDSLSLPVLPEGLAWNIENLYQQGLLEVVALPSEY